ncbi:GNAT family N-acetyltransferase [Dehalogenimonas alkenigignens]|uniref:Acetyltransferase (GNAT) family n=1 Tax=Dehalogenimonas alkenigignens TaxID=1217799 RepID=A0A0W0GIH8_9CHLR|nr:GNAT family N-acetyltransferase [Dehalogenimonas alkenigignens]KTB48374.1 Acetyltransferase (GNAT) family [Dehalogenimonas alkenigignens]
MPLKPELVLPASVACARAFADDPTTDYLIPDANKRANLRFAEEYYLRLSLISGGGTFVTSEKCEGLAMWIDSERKDNFFNHLRAGFPFLPLRCGWRYLFREAALDLHFSRLRKELVPTRHMYLAVLAVDPEYHGQGFASKLMRPMLGHLDDRQLLAYLETQTPRNVEMYRRWGFELLREESMPGSDLKLYLMSRQPKRTAQERLIHSP